MNHPFSLDGQNVLIVGASSGIGAATARLASELGARVVLASRTASKLEAVRKELAHPERATIVTLDYLNAEDVQQALTPFDTIDHVVIPAVADENKKRGPFISQDVAVMRSSFDKFWGQIHVLRAVAPKVPPGGSMVLFSSIAGLKPGSATSGLSVMNGVQAAVIQLGRSLALELAPRRVNVLAPGVVLTQVWTAEQRKELETWMTNTLPVRRAGQAEHVAQAAVSMMTNPYLTGAVLTVDGGLHLV